jgi:plasmid stabilization system protein ParE
MRRYRIEYEHAAMLDLKRLHQFSIDAAPDFADAGLKRIDDAIKTLEIIPHSCRKAQVQSDRNLRELVIDQGKSGYLALFEIRPADYVLILAVRHQRESDYH